MGVGVAVLEPPVLGAERPPVLSLEGVEKRWRGLRAPVLDGVALELGAGTLAFVGGQNGSGKTTLLRIAAGLFAPDRGRVVVCGMDPVRQRREYQARVGFVPAGTSGLYARLTVAAHLRLWARLALMDGAVAREAAGAATARFGLADLLDRRVDRLSMGQRQRLRLALAFLHDPDLVLLDEPLGSLDEPGARLLQEALDEHAARGGAVLWCAPEPSGASFDRLYWLEGGRLTQT
jgi:ABC-2 type transport system ATP-binding protein